MNDKATGWERETIEKLLFQTINEQKRRRRWTIFFRLLFLGIFLFFFVMATPLRQLFIISYKQPHTALINIRGPIFDISHASADNIIRSLHYAFKDPQTKGIILQINSPGGSPVQADYVYDEIKRLRARYKDKKVYAVCVDLCASAAYYIAAAADTIVVNPNTLIGSIGALMNGFGFVEAMQKLGIERRLMTSGEHKGFLDPFSPVKPGERQHAQRMLMEIGQRFAAKVKNARGNKLAKNPELFSGLVWTGTEAMRLGLADRIGTTQMIARDMIQAKHVIDYTIEEHLFERLSKTVGSSFASGLLEQLSKQQVG